MSLTHIPMSVRAQVLQGVDIGGIRMLTDHTHLAQCPETFAVAFKLAYHLRKLSRTHNERQQEYVQFAEKCEIFSCGLLDYVTDMKKEGFRLLNSTTELLSLVGGIAVTSMRDFAKSTPSTERNSHPKYALSKMCHPCVSVQRTCTHMRSVTHLYHGCCQSLYLNLELWDVFLRQGPFLIRTFYL